jgi:hypothetical protein
LVGVLLLAAYSMPSNQTPFLEATPQSKKARVMRTKRRAGKRRQYVPSSSVESEGDDHDWNDDRDHYHEYEHEYSYNPHDGSYYFNPSSGDVEREHQYRHREDPWHLHGQQAINKALKVPSLKNDVPLRQAIYKAKHRKVQAKASDMEKFIATAREAFSKEAMRLGKQSFKPTLLSSGVYKLYVDGRYACTATHVGNRIYVVLHCLSENIETEYKAVNHANTITLRGSDVVVVNKEIAYFPVNGIPSPFKTNAFKVLEDAAIVTVYGYGSGQSPEPDAIVGFASPLGWCNAPTRDGDCTAPVLDQNGKIVGFWTHGNGKDFGRFERVTPEFLEAISEKNKPAFHTGLLFRSSPPSPLSL